MMTLDEAIKHCEERGCGDTECAAEHRQLAEWLKELKKTRSETLPKLTDGIGQTRLGFTHEQIQAIERYVRRYVDYALRIQSEPVEWSEEDKKHIEYIEYLLNQEKYNHPQYQSNIDERIAWLKSLKDRVQPQKKWTPNEEQIEALVSAIDVMIDNRGAGDKNTILLSGLYHELKAL